MDEENESCGEMPVIGTSRKFKGVLFLCLLFAYTLSGSREQPWGDARHTYEVAQRVVTEGRIDITYYWPPSSIKGPDGKVYSSSGLLQTVVNIPVELLLQLVSYIFPGSYSFAWPLMAHIPPALFGALLCLIFFRLCRMHGATNATSSACTAFLAFGTMVWVYARYPYADILQALCFLGFFYQLLRVEDSRSPRAALALGAWAGMLINTKMFYAVPILGGALYLVWVLRADYRRMAVLALWATLAFFPFILLLGGYNYLRWGSPFLTGYEPVIKTVTGESAFSSLLGMFFSSGKSVLFYNLPIILSLCLLPRFVKRHHRTALAMALTLIPPILSLSDFHIWPGGWCWGSRYLLFIVPPLLLPMISLFKTSFYRHHRQLLRPLLGAFFICSSYIQILGNAFYWDHYIRIAKAAREDWLGTPKRVSRVRPINGSNHCNDCIEDMFPLIWLPIFQPIAGHHWLLKHILAGDDWKKAEADASWDRYTPLRLNIKTTYNRVRLDWWGLLWIVDHPNYFRFGLCLLGVLFAGFAISLFLWLHRLRC